MPDVKYCVNFRAMSVEGSVSPVFRSDRLRPSQHEYCELHAHDSLGEAAAKAVLMENVMSVQAKLFELLRNHFKDLS